jgi:radical SAM protein with 4Fe4S-binding SPASM domain
VIDLTRLYCGETTAGESIRYQWRLADSAKSATTLDRKPVVVWNITRTCNLKCLHCYSDSEPKPYAGELTTEEALHVLDDLAAFKCPAVLFSGGEPLLRHDIFDLAWAAKEKGLRATLSSNGTLITHSMAEKIKAAGFSYVGLSLDGIGMVHDYFRGVEGAFEKTLQAVRYLKEVGQKVGLRLTMTRHTVKNLPEILQLMITEKIDRACFYHLVFTGRGRFLRDEALSPEEVREALDQILSWTKTFHLFGLKKEVLTVGHPADGIYLYLKLLSETKTEQADGVLQLIRANGGGQYGSGVGLGCIDPFGNVHPDQFWTNVSLGNVKQIPFSEIWMDCHNELMKGLKNRLPLLKGRCASCRWKNECGGGLRTRAYLEYDDPWAEDPGCYLFSEETAAV